MHDLREGWREFVRHEWLWVTTGQLTVVIAVVNSVAGLLGPMLAKVYLGGAWAWSLVMVAQVAGQVGGAGWAAKLRPARPMRVATLCTAALRCRRSCCRFGLRCWWCWLARPCTG
ncbi:hypothetical protein [Streptomyces sp. NPDC048489]|uniref:hypothetical protein n=1 Tax=Streptomyces sp. NPDC048489 TaxID=3154504 RepID=UPI003436AC97